MNNTENIDLVYLWCDMSDPQWNANRKAVAEKWKDDIALTNEETIGRYQSHDELRYSLRSMEMYAPWINNVFVVVSDDNTLPSWLDTDNPRLHVIRHSDIIPQQFLPTYNSVTIEHFISRIPDLSEHFLYANDDMFFFGDVTPGFFFNDNDDPIRRVSTTRLPVSPQNYYYDTINNSYKLVKSTHEDLSPDIRYDLTFIPFHNIDSYRKSHNIETFNRYKDDIQQGHSCPFRTSRDIQRALYLMEEVATHGATTVIIDSATHPDSLCYSGKEWRKGLDNALRLRPKLLCINASAENTPDDFAWIRLAMEMLFPEPSSFEKV